VGAKKTKKGSKTKSSKEAAKTSAKEARPESKRPVDVEKIRENIREVVWQSAEEIANGVIAGAKRGQLASAKYLFEAVGLYPAPEETAIPEEHSLAHTLLTRMGIPLDSVAHDGGSVSTAAVPAKRSEREEVDRAEDDLGGRHDKKERPVLAEGER